MVKWMSKIVLSIVCLLFVAGCTPVQRSHYQTTSMPRVDWPVDEYTKIASRTGQNHVSGQCFLKTRGGDVKTCAGNKVMLNPISSYSTQFVKAVIKQNYGVGVELGLVDNRIYNYLVEVIADGDGRFSFYNVPDGDYYIYSTVTWEAGTGYNGANQLQGGWVFKEILVDSKSRNEHILTK
tara:strand:- start:51493 stop:52032 length:540 start_codon:yes stop_codon:yes gene_type:complete